MKPRRRSSTVNVMARKLSEEDRRAVDLLLDHATGDGGITRVAAHVSQKRLAAAEKLLKLIGHFQAEEPSENLVEKTMRRIDRATGRHGHLSRRPHAAAQPPVA